MPRNRESALQTKVVQIVFGLGLLGIVVFATKSMMFGSTMITKALAAAIVGAAVIFALDRRYWLLSAFLFGFYDSIPYLKFTGAELGSLILVSVYFVRLTLRREQGGGGMKAIFLSSLPFMAWMCLVWAMNPTGMLIFGSSSIGGRFYFKVVLAFLAMGCLSQMCLDEIECKMLGFSIVAGYLAHTASILYFGDVGNAFFGSGSHYSFIPLSFVAPIFLCRFSAPELFLRVRPFWGFLLIFGLSFYSGNRTAAARPVVVGILAPFFLRRDRIKTMGLFFVAAFILFFLVVGQGRTWNLPYAIQRPLSVLPGKWDWRLRNYGLNDDFRSTLRMYAREHIRDNPWFGDGGFSLDLQDIAWTNARNKHGDVFSGHVVARNWHNVWLGMAADFGIPLSVAWGLFMAVLLIHGYKGTSRLPPGSWRQTMYLYFYLLVLTEFLNFFFNGGHTSLTAQQLFLWAGLMMAVRNGMPETPPPALPTRIGNRTLLP